MQEILVVIFIAGAAIYLGHFFYSSYFSGKKKCDGCAMHQMRELKLPKQDSQSTR